MKKVNLFLLAAATFLLVACGGDDKPEKINFSIQVEQGGSLMDVKNGYVLNADTHLEDGMIELKGKLKTDKEFILNVDIKRKKAEVVDQLCINKCSAGNSQETQTMEFVVKDMTTDVEWHSAEANTVVYTFYQKDDTSNKITFTVNFNDVSL